MNLQPAVRMARRDSGFSDDKASLSSKSAVHHHTNPANGDAEQSNGAPNTGEWLGKLWCQVCHVLLF